MVQIHDLDELLDFLASETASHITCLRISAKACKVTLCQDQHLQAAPVLFHVTTSRQPKGHLVEKGNVWFELAKISRWVQGIHLLCC